MPEFMNPQLFIKSLKFFFGRFRRILLTENESFFRKLDFWLYQFWREAPG